MVKGKVTEADTPTIWMGDTPSGLIHDPPPNIRSIFTPDALLLQPSHFILPWYRHQICWLAYPVALKMLKVNQVVLMC